MRKITGLVGLILVSLLMVQAQPPATFPLLEGAPWPVWGRDLRKSHFQNLPGPNRPRVLWTDTRAGAVDETAIDPGLLWVPQSWGMDNGRYRGGYSFFTLGGGYGGTFGPFYGNPTTPIFTYATLVYVTENQQGQLVRADKFCGATRGPFLPDEYYPLILLSGGQSDLLIYTVDPICGTPYLFNLNKMIDTLLDKLVEEGDWPPFFQYQTNSFGVYWGRSIGIAFGTNLRGEETGDCPPVFELPEDGFSTTGDFAYVTFCDSFGRLWWLSFTWLVKVNIDCKEGSDPPEDPTWEMEGYDLFPNPEIVAPDFYFPFLPSKAYSAFSSATINFGRNYVAFLGATTHDGQVIGFGIARDNWAPTPVWSHTIQSLSERFRDRVVSDSFDRPMALTSDNQKAIVAGVKSGRVYAFNVTTGAPLWRTHLKAVIGGGPAIAKVGNTETVYVTTVKPGRLYALDPANGRIKWWFNMASTCRCMPTVDSNGVIYVGDDQGNLYAVNPNGKQKWRMKLGHPITVAPVIGPNRTLIVSAGNKILYGIGEQR